MSVGRMGTTILIKSKDERDDRKTNLGRQKSSWVGKFCQRLSRNTPLAYGPDIEREILKSNV